MKTYVFENVLNSNIIITIRARTYTDAMEVLLIEVKDIDNYKLT